MRERDPDDPAGGLHGGVGSHGQQRQRRGGDVDLAPAALAADGTGELGEQLLDGRLPAEQPLHLRRDLEVSDQAPPSTHDAPSRLRPSRGVSAARFSHTRQTGLTCRSVPVAGETEAAGSAWSHPPPPHHAERV